MSETTTVRGPSAEPSGRPGPRPARPASPGARRSGAAAVAVAATLAALTLLDTLRVQRAISSWDTYLTGPTERSAALYLVGTALGVGGAWPCRRGAAGVLGLVAAGYLATMTGFVALPGQWEVLDAVSRAMLPALPLLGVVVGVRTALGRDGGPAAGDVDRRPPLHLTAILLAPLAGAAAHPGTTDLKYWIWGPELSATTFLLPLAPALVPAAALATAALRGALRGDVDAARRRSALLGILLATTAACCLVVARDRNGIFYPHGEPWRVPTAVALLAAVVLGACAGRATAVRHRVVLLAALGAAAVPAVLGPVVPLLWHPTPSGTVAGWVALATVAAAAAAAAVAARRAEPPAVSRPATPGGP